MPSLKIIGLLVLKKNTFKGFSIYSHGGHFGQVTLTINTNFRSPSTNFGFDRAMRLQRRCLDIIVIYMYISPRQEQTTTWVLMFS